MNISNLKGKLVISVQAAYGEPLYEEACINGLLKSVVNGGASAVRVAGVRDVKNAKRLLDVPVVGLTKPKFLPDNWMDVVYITPTMNDIESLLNAGADVVALDATNRERNFKLQEAVTLIHSHGKFAMADISSFEEGMLCTDLGFDIISTTLSGYTTETKTDSKSPDFELLENLTKNTNVPVFLEGRVWEPYHVKRAFELNAHSVVIGSAITRPQLIVKRFMEESK